MDWEIEIILKVDEEIAIKSLDRNKTFHADKLNPKLILTELSWNWSNNTRIDEYQLNILHVKEKRNKKSQSETT